MQCLGVEAQTVSFGLCQRGVRWNVGPSDKSERRRVEIVRADFREWVKREQKQHGTFDLVTVSEVCVLGGREGGGEVGHK